MAIIRALSFELSRMQPLLADQTGFDSRYGSENMSLKSRPDFRSCPAQWPVEKNHKEVQKFLLAPPPPPARSHPCRDFIPFFFQAGPAKSNPPIKAGLPI